MIKDIHSWTSNAFAMNLNSALRILVFPDGGQLTRSRYPLSRLMLYCPNLLSSGYNSGVILFFANQRLCTPFTTCSIFYNVPDCTSYLMYLPHHKRISYTCIFFLNSVRDNGLVFP